MKLDDDTIVTAAQLAWLTGLSDRALRGYANRGVVVRAGRGKYLLGESVRRLYHHASEAAAGRSGTNLSDARARLATLQAEGQEMKNGVLRGELIRVDDFNGFWGSLMVSNRNMYLGTPRQISFEIPTLTAVDRSTIERICRQNLEDAALQRGYFSGGKNDKIGEGEND
jgi:phage terminase Nu1 subunit (DNA packaging protein)